LDLNLNGKKAQKNAKKNITSDAINKIIPILIPLRTYELWCPSKVASLITSRHHTDAINITNNNPKLSKKKPYW
jgi:hypothetical protein